LKVSAAPFDLTLSSEEIKVCVGRMA